ncbi:J domain-containing protein [Paenarthrobacter sp. CCNWLY172]|uniref:J domain-containing protein n=1 Tax=Micrococcaceae TaxID=1268 RepID=UPI001A9897C0|nr:MULTISPECIES: J domain-containing protein [Micrococcaceae]WGM21747.1 J domain-containing protein [Paenarthrobacter sp. OM7]
MSDQPDHYATLHVSPDATTREIARAYRTLLRTHHPDTRQKVDDGDTTSAADLQELHAIMQAYVVLSDPGKRAAYDQARRSGVPAGRPGTPVNVRVHRHEPAASKEPGRPQPPLSFGPTRWEPSSRTLRTPRSHS